VRRQAILHGAFAVLLGERDKADAFARKAAHDFFGAVGRAVAADQDFDALARIIQRKQIAELFFDAGFFVVCGDDDADERLSGAFGTG
jgi:hypothetical protein